MPTLICDCNQTMPLKTQALGEALHEELTLHSALCRREAGAFQKAIQSGDDVVVACTQEKRLFAELSEQTVGAVSPIKFVNIRETGGWSRDAASASPKIAALLAAPSQRVVYFDFDSFVIKDEFKGLLDSHAKVLTREAGKRLVIEGHTDDRGGREYNLALGPKRAESVLKSLSLLGVPERQLEAVSFGEERPAANGADETAWARNRRAELKDR